MNLTPPEGHEPADLSQLAATDALLDRLGARAATEDDLGDPTSAALAEMLTMIDEYREPDLGLSQLVEVLAGRPLYLTAPDETVEQLRVDAAAEQLPEGSLIGPEPRLIDLTEHGRAELVDLAGVTVGEPAADGEAGGQVAAFVPRQPAARRWERALSQVSIPAACVVLLLLLGSGVTAAVTGDPMTAMNGVSRVMAQLPGVDNSQRKLTQVQGEIDAANTAVQQHDESSANQHLDAARRGLPDVPAASKTQLSVLIANVQTQLTGTPTATPVVQSTAPSGGPVAASATPTPAAPTPTAHPSVSATSPPPSEAPTTAPEPTSVVATSDPGIATQAPVEPSPAAATSGS